MSSCNVRVITRFRPQNAREKEEAAKVEGWRLDFTDQTITLCVKGQSYPFSFDRVFDMNCTQGAVYEVVAKKTIDEVLEGYNGTIFAYGQTGSGKTFTMFGPDAPAAEELKGIIPKASMHIFAAIEADTKGTEFAVKVSFLEIYKEQVRDLLAANPDKTNIKIRETPQKGVFIEGLTEEFVRSEDDIADWLALGENSRSVAFTKMNSRSSRSHSVLIISIEQKLTDGSSVTGKLNLVDLAGSEKISKTGAEGNTLEEAKKINQSLSTLGKCIHALTEGKPHIPFRESKLTRILQESLGGNCKTTLVITCSPDPFNAEETLSTLNFGKRAKTIKNVVTVNAQKSAAELEKMLVAVEKTTSAWKSYATKLEKQIDFMRKDDWEPSKPLPKDCANATAPPRPAFEKEFLEEMKLLKSRSGARSANNGETSSGSASADADGESHAEGENADGDKDEQDTSITGVASTQIPEEFDVAPATIDEVAQLTSKLQAWVEANTANEQEKFKSFDTQEAEGKAKLEVLTEELKEKTAIRDKLQLKFDIEFKQNQIRIQKLEKENADRQAETKGIEDQITSMNKHGEEIQAHIAQSEDSIMLLYMDNEKSQQEVQETREAIKGFADAMDEQRQAEVSLQRKAAHLDSEMDILKKSIARISKENDELENRASAELVNLDKTKEQLVQSIAAAQAAAEKVGLLQKQADELLAQLTSLENLELDEKNLQQQIVSTVDGLHGLNKELKNLVEHNIALKQMLRQVTNASGSEDDDPDLQAMKQQLEGTNKQMEEIRKQQREARMVLLKKTEAAHAANVAKTESIQQSLQQNNEKKSEFEQKAAQLKASLAENDVEKQLLENQVNMSHQTENTISYKNETLAIELQKFLFDKDSLQSDLEGVRKVMDTHRAVVNETQPKVEELQRKVENERELVAKLQSEHATTLEKMQELRTRSMTQSNALKEQKQRLAEAETKITNLYVERASLSKSTDESKFTKENLEKEYKKLKLQRAHAEKVLENMKIREEQIQQRRHILFRSAAEASQKQAFAEKVDLNSHINALRRSGKGSVLLLLAKQEHERSQTPRGENKLLGGKISAAQRKWQGGSIKIGGRILSEEEIQPYWDLFNTVDKDGSGSIDIDEMRQCLLDAGKNMSEADLKNLMDDLDDDKNGSIDFEEFVLGMVQLDTTYTT